MLSIVSTPIGNLKDITIRAMENLASCDAIVCEDTRVAGQLLHLLHLPKKELISFHGYTHPKKADDIMERLKSDQHLCLVSDAGTPAISDPGFVLIQKARAMNLPVEVIPGPSAFLAALSSSGLPVNRFVYLGFLPLKKGRRTLLTSLIDERRTIVFYESPHRIEKTLRELGALLIDQPDRPIVIARELTKLHEEVTSTMVKDLGALIGTMTMKGEFVVVIGGKT